MRKSKRIIITNKRELGEILFEANLLIERQIHIIKSDLDSFTLFIAELKKKDEKANADNE